MAQKRDDCSFCNIFSFLRPAKRNIIQDSAAASGSRSVSSFSKASASTLTKNTQSTPLNAMDFTKADFRAFVFVIHPDHGFMLLYCTRKKKKPDHFQLPGGHVDDFEFKEAAKLYPEEPLQQLLHAGRLGASRELFEETGLDFRKDITRLAPAKLYKKVPDGQLGNEYKRRLFYTIYVNDSDFPTREDLPVSEAAFLRKPMGTDPPNLLLKLSHEHQGYKFEKYSDVTINLLQHHSGGKCSEALKMGTKVSEDEGVGESMELLP